MRWSTVRGQGWWLARRLLPPPARGLLRRALPVEWLPAGSFERAYRRRAGLREDEPLTPLQQMYVDFALSSNARGAWAAQIIQRYRQIEGSRCLDIGCAYGGFLVELGKAGARTLVGIDVDAGLLDLARVNLAEHNLRAELRLVDLHDRRAIGALGSFDIVVANDVLEHVDDLPLAIENCCRLTADGGVLYAVIPNKYFVRYLLKDGHYQLPGITLLSCADSRAYYATTGRGDPYSVGHYRTLDYYLHHLRKNGMEVELFRSGLGVYDLSQLEEEFEGVRQFFASFADGALPDALTAKISRRARAVCDSFGALMERYERASAEGSADAPALAEKLLLRYGMEAWHLIARKGA